MLRVSAMWPNERRLSTIWSVPRTLPEKCLAARKIAEEVVVHPQLHGTRGGPSVTAERIDRRPLQLAFRPTPRYKRDTGREPSHRAAQYITIHAAFHVAA